MPTTMAIATTTTRAMRTIMSAPDLNGAQRIFRQVRSTKEILSSAVTSRTKRATRFDKSTPLHAPVNFLYSGFLKMGTLYKRLLNLNNLHEAYIKSKSGVEWKESVQKYGIYELAHIQELSKALKYHTYRQKPFYEFDINERGKQRHIKSLHISDRVLQRALCDQILTPELQKYLIYDNGASVKGKGIEFSRRRLKIHLTRYYKKHGRDGYILLIDFSKYFDNIRHDKLLEMIAGKINDEEVIALLRHLIMTFDTAGNTGRSVGIGSQISQIAGIFYPARIDNYCKIVRSVKYYGRYMDDTYIIHNDKQYLRDLLHDIQQICDELGIIINKKKTQIVKLSNGFTFLKMRYLITDTGKIIVIPCKAGITRERRKLRKLKRFALAGRITPAEIRGQYKSWRGNLIKYNAYKSIRSTDALYKSLFGGKHGNEEKGIN